MKKSILLILLMSVVELSAQRTLFSANRNSNYQDTVWIITGKRELGSNFQKQRLDFSIDARQTLISNTTARMTGLRLGVEYRRVHRFGIGAYGLGDGIYMKSLRELDTNISEAVLNLSYLSLYYERVLFFNKKWEWSATAHIGRGQITGSFRTSPDSTWSNFPTRDVKPFEISTTGYYHLTWWCSVGAGIGYRYMRSTPIEVRPIYNAPVAIARVRIKFGKLIKSIWDKDTKNEY